MTVGDMLFACRGRRSFIAADSPETSLAKRVPKCVYMNCFMTSN
jgi:hypothetical protein